MKAETMTKAQQRMLARSICKGIQADVLNAIGKLPSNWDGIELRQLVSDIATRHESKLLVGKRRKDYENDLLTRNI